MQIVEQQSLLISSQSLNFAWHHQTTLFVHFLHSSAGRSSFVVRLCHDMKNVLLSRSSFTKKEQVLQNCGLLNGIDPPACCVLVLRPEGVVQCLLVVEVKDVAALLSIRPLRQFNSEALQRQTL